MKPDQPGGSTRNPDDPGIPGWDSVSFIFIYTARCRIAEPTIRLETEADNNQNSQFACKNLNITQIKEDGDEHLPLVERARVRMGKQ